MFSDKIWWTRQARIRTERRLLSNAFHSQVILFWYSFYSVAVSIYFIGNAQGDSTNRYWLIYSVLVLVISGFINGLSYKERASLIKENYEHLHTLYTKLIIAEKATSDTKELIEDYESILNKSENHLAKDYLEALFDNYYSSTDKSKVTPHPTGYQKTIAIINKVSKFFILVFLYSLPALITYALETLKNSG